MSLGYPKALRLLKRSQFRWVLRRGRRLVGRYLILEVAKNCCTVTRLGLTVSKKYGKAHERNRFKRCAREAFRLSYPELLKGVDMNISPRTEAKSVGSLELQEELKKLISEWSHSSLES